MAGETPDLGELLVETSDFTLGRIHVSMPATIVAYNPALQTCTVKPCISGRYADAELEILVPFPLPTISNVPVRFPSGTGFAITWPLIPGDTVHLIIADRSMDEWKSTGAPENIPQDIRRFDLTDAIAVPGLRPLTNPIPATGWSATGMVLEGASIQLGSSTAFDPIALSSLVSAELAKIVSTFNLHTHVATGFGVPTSTPLPLAAAPSTVAALKAVSYTHLTLPTNREV